MPTRYTDCIENDVSFKEFAFGCARAFGALYHLRDNMLIYDEPKKRVTCSLYVENMNKAQTEIDKIKNMTDDDINIENMNQYNNEMCEYYETLRRGKELKEKYEQMLYNVLGYNPPSNDFVGYKNFMIDQIENSMNSDCNTSYITKPIKQNSVDWKRNKIKKLLGEIDYNKKQQKEEIGRIEKIMNGLICLLIH